MKSKILIILTSVIMFSGCSKMDLNPLSQGSSSNWYSDETEITMSLNKLFDTRYYENLRYALNGDIHDQFTDDWFYRNFNSIITGGTINGTSSTVTDWWTRWYECIQSANLIIENADRAKDKLSAEKLNKYIGVAKFARAAHYSLLIFYYGDVPFYTKSLSIKEAFALSRTNKADILKAIYEDFDFAATYLPTSYGSTEIKYPTKGAALAMKARIALYMGEWAVARDAAKACMDLGVYQLNPVFSDLFGTKYTVETVFATALSVALGNNVNFSQIVCRNCGGYSTYGPSWDLLCSFLCTDGLPIDESPLFDPHEPFKNRDPRLAETIVPFGTYHLGVRYQPHPDTLKVWSQKTGALRANNDSRGVDQYASWNGIIWKKWLNKDGWVLNNQFEMSNIIMRYADVLLMYAEAKIEMGETDQSVRDAINRVRARAYGVSYTQTSSYPAVTSSNQAELRKTVRIERRMEFAFEGRRLADILRWKIAHIALNKNNYGMLDPVELRTKVVKPGLWFFPEIPSIDENGIPDFESMYSKGLIKLESIRKFDGSRNYLFPIPSKEILINSNLTQNPNY